MTCGARSGSSLADWEQLPWWTRAMDNAATLFDSQM